MKKALITGITGQDGSYLSEHLLDMGYEVHGIVRRHSVAENQDSRISKLSRTINTYYGDLLDYPSLARIVNDVKPDEIYNLGAMSNGILFNHESPRRGSNFVTNKVVKGAVSIKKGLQNKLELGNMDSYRDWGHSKDYVRAMHMIVNHATPEEFIVSTGETHSVRDLCEVVFSKLGLDYKDYVVQNPKFMRPEELKYLKGDSERTREILGWKPEYTFESMLEEMIERWENEL